MQLDNNNILTGTGTGSKRLDRATAVDWLEFADLFPPSVDLLTIDDRNMAGSIEKRINGEREKVRKFWPISSCRFIQSQCFHLCNTWYISTKLPVSAGRYRYAAARRPRA